MSEKTIITAAITGSIHVPSMSEFLPSNNQDIIEDAIAAARAGAAVVHIHAREDDGKPTNDVEMVRHIHQEISRETEAIICVTTGGSTSMTVPERLAAVAEIKPELASCNAGTMNFNFSGIAKQLDNPKYDWEKEHVLASSNTPFMNTFDGMTEYITTMQNNGTKPEFEIYDVGMINNLSYLMKTGVLKGPIYIQFVMGILGGIPATIENLLFLYKTAKEQIGEENFAWSVAAAGRHQFDIVTAGMLLGGNIRVGLEDNLYLKKGVLSESNKESVEKARLIVETHDRVVATPEEARKILRLK